MRVVVLGGTVFIGRAIVEELASHGNEVLVVHRGNHEPERPEGLEAAAHVHVDRSELSRVRGELDDFGPHAFVDTCAITKAHAETALDALPDGPRLLVLSSMDVYRAYGSLIASTETDPSPQNEASPVREERYPFRGKAPGMDDYEKLDVEESYLARGATVCRLPMVYGERDYQRREELVLRRVRAGRARIPVGAGTWLTTRGYVRDIASAVRLALRSDAAELVRVDEKALPEDLSSTGSVRQHLLVDSSKARSMLGWRDSDPVEALRRSVRWHLDNPPEGASDDFSDDDRALAQPR